MDAISERLTVPYPWSRSGGHGFDSSGSYVSFEARDDRPATVHSTRSSSGWRPPSPWSRKSARCMEATLAGRWKFHGIYFSGNSKIYRLDVYTFPSASHEQYVEDVAVNQCLLKLSDQKSDLGQNFAQRQMTADLVADTADEIRMQVTDFKNRNPHIWSQVKHIPGRRSLVQRGLFSTLPSKWLALVYGWRPLLSDVKGAFDVLKAVDSDGVSQRLSVTSHFKDARDSYIRHTSIGCTVPATSAGTCDKRHHDVVSVKVRVDYYLDNPALHEMQQLSLANPAQLAWNLLPYSFVVDWFLPVSTYLQASTATLGLSFLGGSISTFRTRDVTLENLSLDYGDNSSIFMTGGYLRNMFFTRTVLSSFPHARVPHFKNPVSLAHMTNSLAMLARVFS